MSSKPRLSEVVVYTPPDGWARVTDAPDRLVAVLRSDVERPDLEAAAASFGVVQRAARSSRVALDRYLARRVGQGRAEVVSDPRVAPDALRAAWTDGVSDTLTWLTTRGGGVLLEYAKDPWRVEGDPVELAREHLDRLRWLEDAKRR